MADNERWMDDVDEDESLSIVEFDVTSSPNDFNFLTLMSFMGAGSIVIPHYQRNYTWDKKRASKLVESLIIGLPVPQIFLYEESRNRFAVLDGQQRLMSMYFFSKGRFPKKEKRAILREMYSEKNFFPENILEDNEYFSEFALYLPGTTPDTTSPFHDLKYATLGDHQTSLDLRTVRSVVVKQNDPDPQDDDRSAVYEIFDRLNTGGMNLKPQEIRSNIYFSSFYSFLSEKNKDQRWRQLIGRPSIDTNLRDVELLLRLFAMLTMSDKYKPSMTRFLNAFSFKAKKYLITNEFSCAVSLLTTFCNWLKMIFLPFSQEDGSVSVRQRRSW